MIYVSSACSRENTIFKAVKELAEKGFRNIELTGGTRYYEGYEKDLITLKEKYNLHYLLHNYFPPPKTDFVVNLASLDDQIFQQSLDHLKKALKLSQKLNLAKFGFHAGFFVDIPPENIGGRIAQRTIRDRAQAMNRFCEGYKILQQEAEGIELYIENNVYSSSNYSVYQEHLPFMLLCGKDINELKKKINFKLLLDVGHLFVTSCTIKLDFYKEFHALATISDYIHVSDNDGLHDTNQAIDPEGEIFKLLSQIELHDKIITLEIYESPDAIRESLNLLNILINRSKKSKHSG